MCSALPSKAAVRIDTVLIKLKYYYYYSMDFLSFFSSRFLSFQATHRQENEQYSRMCAMLNYLIYISIILYMK